jgi:hypothetical protein
LTIAVSFTVFAKAFSPFRIGAPDYARDALVKDSTIIAASAVLFVTLFRSKRPWDASSFGVTFC